MVLHDMQCDKCGAIVEDMPVPDYASKCVECKGGVLEIMWRSPHSRNAAAINTQDMTVVYEHPGTGKVLYPGRNDVAMPDRYQQQGYVRREMRSLREIDRFSERHGLVNERANYNSGNAYDSEPGRG